MPWLERGCYAGVRGACVGFTCGLLGLVEEWGGSADIAHHQQHHRRLGHGKLGMAACGVGLVWLALSQGAFSILWVLAPIAGFVALVVIHEKLLKELERRKRAARLDRKST